MTAWIWISSGRCTTVLLAGQATVTHIRVGADRAGAEVIAVSGTGNAARDEVAPDSAEFGAAAREETIRRRESESQARLDEFRVRMNGRDLAGRRAVEGLDGTLAALRDGLVSDVLCEQ